MKTGDENIYPDLRTPETPPEKLNLHKGMVDSTTKVGSRIYQRGAHYIVTGEGGQDYGKHWILTREDKVTK